MIPVFCRVVHEPENGKYGDCVRACVASLLEMEPEAVEHFYGDGCDGETGLSRIRAWLNARDLAPFFINFDGQHSLDEILAVTADQNPDVHYMVFGRTEGGFHVVVAQNDKVVHDPNWYPTPLVGSGSDDMWTLMVIVKR